MSKAFEIDIHHSRIHYEISDGHTPAGCDAAQAGSTSTSTASSNRTAAGNKSKNLRYLGVSRDKRRNKWRAAIRVVNRASQHQHQHQHQHQQRHRHGPAANLVVLGFFDTAHEAALKYDAAAAAAGRATNFARSVGRRWAWKCGAKVNGTALAAAALRVLKRQSKFCPGMWNTIWKGNRSPPF
jgi:hypothetical protein